jgi:hypothetical protein
VAVETSVQPSLNEQEIHDYLNQVIKEVKDDNVFYTFLLSQNLIRSHRILAKSQVEKNFGSISMTT